MKLRNLLRPVYLARRTHYKFYELLHPDEPWLAQDAVQFCKERLDGTQVGLEWGSGRSTLWFGERCKTLLSLEHNPMWHTKVVNQLQKKGFNHVECRYIALDHDPKLPTQRFYEKQPKYVRVIEEFADNSLDWVIVDGHYRQACIDAALPKIKKGGFLLVDNTNWLSIEEWGLPPDWPIVHQSSNVMTQTTIWQKP